MFRLENNLDKLHAWLTDRRYLQLFTAFTRCLLAIGFIPPSIPKILHRPFTMLPDTNPAGAYFAALYNTGFYYEFIGWSQITAAVLLLIPRTSHLGAFMFLPIIINIAVLTSSVGFKGTWVVTIFMSLAAIWLNLWEYDRYKALVFRTRYDHPVRSWRQFIAVAAFFAVGGAASGVFAWFIRLGNFNNYLFVSAALAVAGCIFGLIVTLHFQSMPTGRLTQQDAPR